MKKGNKNKGITLIALIITIIVMLILVGVTVNVALNGGLFSTAKRAASGMQMAQIREKAEVVKATLVADEIGDSNIIANIPTYRDRLLEEFDAKETDTNGDNIIEVNDKYVIIIKNSDLDIEVFEKTNIPLNYLLISLGYEISNFEENGKICGINVSLNIPRTMTEEEYIALKKEQETEVATDETKKQVLLKSCYEYFGAEEPFTSIDEAVLYDINYWYGYGPFETLEEALQDETLQADWGTTGGITKEQSYYFLLNDLGYYPEVETESMTEQEVINYYYEEEKKNIYRGEYYKYTTNLNLYVSVNGEETLISKNIRIYETTVNHAIEQNGTYEFILKTARDEEIAREILHVNNIIEGKNSYFITQEEAEERWTTDEKGTITKYTGEDTEVIIPLKIGAENITKIGDNAFRGNMGITSVIIPKGITTIGKYTFYGCGSLKDIIIPNSVVRIEGNTFERCNSLINVVMPDSVTFIGYGVFRFCSNLTNITVSKNIIIQDQTFYGCENLASIVIPEGVSTIRDSAFEGCKNLTSITIPNSVTNMKITSSSTVFKNCTNLTTINFAPGNNPIPEGQPWGAPNENLVVTKLTE